ncbi:MAG: oligoendopeptidase F family protein [Treponema sp.]|nr:oligoendopeptidase F family protein [Treponema sp.]
MSEENIPLRKDIPASDRWDLTALYADDRECKADLDEIPALTEKLLSFKGHLADGPETLQEALKVREAAYRPYERLLKYVDLLHRAGDDGAEWSDNDWTAVCECGDAVSFFDRELCAIADDKLQAWIQDKAFDDYRVYIQKTLHNKPHTLSEKEEEALQKDLQMKEDGVGRDYDSLMDEVDKELGTMHVDGKEQPLTRKNNFLNNPDRAVRKEAYSRIYAAYNFHADTLVAIYAGLVENDISHIHALRYKSLLEAAFYPDNISVSVYKNQVSTVSANLAPLHKYYSIRKRALGLDELHLYDMEMPLVPEPESKTSYEEALEIVRSALAPLGTEYTGLLCGGLLGGWCDRYPNKDKETGATTYICYDGHPLILLNYNMGDPRAVSDMAHECGHAMHDWYSARSNPFLSYRFADFESEVASTFNELLLFDYLMKNVKNNAMKKQILFQRVSFIRGHLYGITRDTEFELAAHEAGEAGKPLTAGSFRALSRGLMEKYYGPEMVLDEYVDIDGLTDNLLYQRAPFHAYRYAIGMVAALALAKKVTEGGPEEREAYLNFLKSGGSHFPLENLRSAGVDMETDEPFQAACDTFRSLVDQLDALL